MPGFLLPDELERERRAARRMLGPMMRALARRRRRERLAGLLRKLVGRPAR